MKHRALLLFIATILIVSACSLVTADVEYIGEDTDTRGDWPDEYGENGAILFAPIDLVDLKDIDQYDDGGNLRWDWANPTADSRGLIYPDDPGTRAGSCIYNNPIGLITIETKLMDYQVAVYVVDWDSSARVQDMVGFQGDQAPDDPDVTVNNPKFNAGVYHIWHVSGKESFNLQITHKGGANWVVSGIFVDGLRTAVRAGDKLAITWGGVKQ